MPFKSEIFTVGSTHSSLMTSGCQSLDLSWSAARRPFACWQVQLSSCFSLSPHAWANLFGQRSFSLRCPDVAAWVGGYGYRGGDFNRGQNFGLWSGTAPPMYRNKGKPTNPFWIFTSYWHFWRQTLASALLGSKPWNGEWGREGSSCSFGCWSYPHWCQTQPGSPGVLLVSNQTPKSET